MGKALDLVDHLLLLLLFSVRLFRIRFVYENGFIYSLKPKIFKHMIYWLLLNCTTLKRGTMRRKILPKLLNAMNYAYLVSWVCVSVCVCVFSLSFSRIFLYPNKPCMIHPHLTIYLTNEPTQNIQYSYNIFLSRINTTSFWIFIITDIITR